MKFRNLYFIFLLFCFYSFSNQLNASNKYHFGYNKGLKVTIVPDSTEFIAGTTATFTVTLTNKAKYNIPIDYPTGQQWDLAIYEASKPIYRWSNDYTWKKSPHTLVLKPGESKSQKLSWTSRNIKGEPLKQGIYKCAGIVTCNPQILVSSPVQFRLTPPSVISKETIKTSLNQCFDIELPRFANNKELIWKIIYANNDNRISTTSKKYTDNTIIITFFPKRIGHVEFDLYAYPEKLNQTVSLERRSYRIEVE